MITCDVCGGRTICRHTVSHYDEVIRKRVCEDCGRVIYTMESQMDSGEAIRLMDQFFREKLIGEKK